MDRAINAQPSQASAPRRQAGPRSRLRAFGGFYRAGGLRLNEPGEPAASGLRGRNDAAFDRLIGEASSLSSPDPPALPALPSFPPAWGKVGMGGASGLRANESGAAEPAPPAAPLGPRAFKAPLSLSASIYGCWVGALTTAGLASLAVIAGPAWFLWSAHLPLGIPGPAASMAWGIASIAGSVSGFLKKISQPQGNGLQLDDGSGSKYEQRWMPPGYPWPVQEAVNRLLLRLGLDPNLSPLTGTFREIDQRGGRDYLNARTVGGGLHPGSFITVGEGYLDERPRLREAVIAHELGHLWLGDIPRWEKAQFAHEFAAAAVEKFYLPMLALAWAMLGWQGALLGLLAPISLGLSNVLKLAFQRGQELRADLFSAWATHPTWIEEFVRRRSGPPDATWSARLDRLFLTHPDSARRLANLAPLARPFRPGAEIQKAREALERRLGRGDEVAIVHEGGRFLLEVVPAQDRPELRALIPSAFRGLPVRLFPRPVLAGALRSLRSELVPDVAQEVFADYSDGRIALVAELKDLSPERLAKLPEKFLGFPVLPLLGPPPIEVEATAWMLSRELVPARVEEVRAVDYGQGYVLELSVRNESPENFEKLAELAQEGYRGLPVSLARAPAPSEVEAVRAALEGELVPAGVAEGVLAVDLGQGYVLVAQVKDASPAHLSKIPASYQGYTVHYAPVSSP